MMVRAHEARGPVSFAARRGEMKRGVLIGVAVAVVLSLPFYGHMWNLFMHIFGAIIFMGNILVTAVWVSLARRSASPEARRFAASGIVTTDVILTTPGALLVLLNGGIIGMEWFKIKAAWIFIALGLFVVAGVIWLGVLVPLQRRLAAVAEETSGAEPVPAAYDALLKRWFRWGGVATLLPLASLALMVFKPTF
jgi:uncharacterized membrane protein